MPNLIIFCWKHKNTKIEGGNQIEPRVSGGSEAKFIQQKNDDGSQSVFHCFIRELFYASISTEKSLHSLANRKIEFSVV